MEEVDPTPTFDRPDSAVYHRSDDLLVRIHYGSELLYIRAKDQKLAFKALSDWVAEYNFTVWAVKMDFGMDHQTELFVVFSR